MKTAVKFTILLASGLLCVAGLVIANSSHAQNPSAHTDRDLISAENEDFYQYAAAKSRPKLTFQQLETIIRRDPTTKSHHARIEFGSVKMEEGAALAEVIFVNDDGRVFPFLYKLQPERDSWKVVNVQRMWYVPRSHLLRGVRV